MKLLRRVRLFLATLAVIIIMVLALSRGIQAPGAGETSRSGPINIGEAAVPVEATDANGDIPGEDYIQLVAVQMRWDAGDYITTERLAARVDGLMQEAAARLDPRYPALVVFPEDIGILTAFNGRGELLEGVDTLQHAVERMVRANLPSVLWNRLRYGVGWVRSVFISRQETMGTTYLQVFSEAARRYGVYLVAGSAPLPDYRLPADGSLPRDFVPLDGNVYNTSYFFGPDGRIIGRQKKVNLIEIEGPAGLDITPAPLETLEVFDTPLGRVGIAICLDAFKDEVLDSLQAQGADILVQPSANPEPWTPAQQADWLQSAWKATAEERRFAYAVNPMMTGQVFNLGFFGQSSIVAREDGAAMAGGGGPNGKHPESGYSSVGTRPGFLAVAGSDDKEEILVVKVLKP